MFVKKSKIKKMTNRIEELEELICPFNSHEFFILETTNRVCSVTDLYAETVTVRKLMCKKCRKIVFDYNGAGMSFKYKVHQND